MKRLVLVLTLILVSASGHASADGGLDADSFKLYGGTWLSDCGNPGSPRVTVSESALVVIEGGRRVDGSNLQNAPSYFGQSPPENYVTTLLADLPSGDQLLAVLYTDAGGIYLALELGPISKGAMGLKYRRCDTPAKASTAQPPPVTATPPTPGLPGASDLLRDPAFKKAYVKALGRFAKEPWLMQLDGPAPETRKVTIAGTEYFLISSCKNHDCAENNMTVLYAPSKNLVQGKVRLAGKSALIGSPPPAVAKELGEYWRKQWGQSR